MKKPKQNMTENSDQIPVDLLIEIFLRLPTKSIAKLRYVSKRWASILNHQHFIELFMTKSLAHPRLLLASQVNGTLFFSSSLQNPNPNNTSSSLDVLVDHQTKFPSDSSSQIGRPVNGFICTQEQKSGKSLAVIYNPATGESLTLPELRTQESEIISYFLGYDPINKEFKVLSMTCCSINMQSKPKKHRVITLGNGKQKWRNIKCYTKHFPVSDAICINGLLYYKAVRDSSLGSLMVCFDVRSEKFSFINIGEGLKEITSGLTLTNYNGKLCGVQYDNRSIELWILEDSKKHKWSKHYYELPDSWHSIVEETCLSIVGMTATCEIVLAPYFVPNPFNVYYYNLEKETFTKIEIQGFEEFEQCLVHRFEEYVENVKSLC